MTPSLCKLCSREFFGLREGSDLCSLHYFKFGRKVGVPTYKKERPIKVSSISPEEMVALLAEGAS